jgi:hypothetical protein
MLCEAMFWKGVLTGIVGTYVVTFILCVILGVMYKGELSDE